MDTSAAPPDPAQAGCLDDLIKRLRLLKVWAGDPSYETIKNRVNAAWTAVGRPASELTHKPTVANCFRLGRRRLNTDLVLAVVEALRPDTGYLTQWRQALWVISGEREAVSQVRVEDRLPQDLPGFTGRIGELNQLRSSAEAVVITAIEGMAGVGKTQLAVHAGHQLLRAGAFDRVLFVNLRGFHPDPAQPPADPAAVLDGFLRLLGMPGHHIPHGLEARAVAYRTRLADATTLVVLDNAATAEQVRPLLPETPGCRTLVTSRRSLSDLKPATHLTVDVFTPEEAEIFLVNALAGGSDPDAVARIADRCGHLPLALSLIAGHIRNTPGWTLADHADRLDERHRDRRLDSGIELALDLSYHHQPADQQRLLRLAAERPNLVAVAHTATRGWPDHTIRLARILSRYLATGYYADALIVQGQALQAATDSADQAARARALADLGDAYIWVGRLGPAAEHLERANDLFRRTGDVLGQADAHFYLAFVVYRAGTYPAGDDHLRQALTLYRRAGDRAGEAGALNTLSSALARSGRFPEALERNRQALALARQTGNRTGEANSLHTLGEIEMRLGQYAQAVDHLRHGLKLHGELGHRISEAGDLDTLGMLHTRLGQFDRAVECHEQALTVARDTGAREGQAWAFNGIGEAVHAAGLPADAITHHTAAHAVATDVGNRDQQARANAGLGRAYHALGNHTRAHEHYRHALVVYTGLGLREADEIRAHLADLEAAGAGGSPDRAPRRLG